MKFNDLRAANMLRQKDLSSGPAKDRDLFLAVGASKEIGKILDKIYARHRGEVKLLPNIRNELADAVIYLDLLAANYGIDLAQSICEKFNRTSKEYDSEVRLEIS